MTAQVQRSQVQALANAGVDFEKAVHQYIEALKWHRSTVGVARPMATSLVESAVRKVPQGEGQPDDFVPDYEIIDDLPPAPTLAQRRVALLNEIGARERAAVMKLAGIGKQRLMNADRNRIMGVLAKLKTTALIAAQTGKADPLPLDEQQAVADRVEREFAQLHVDDWARLEEIRAFDAKVASIERKGAELMAEIEDMDEQQLDAFTMPAWLKND